jgi:hypothetical protein
VLPVLGVHWLYVPVAEGKIIAVVAAAAGNAKAVRPSMNKNDAIMLFLVSIERLLN